MRQSGCIQLDMAAFALKPQTPGPLISRKFTREGGAVGWNKITGI